MTETIFKCSGLIVAAMGILLSLAKDMFEVEKVISDPDIVHTRYVYRRRLASIFRHQLFLFSIYVFLVTILITFFAGSYYLLKSHFNNADFLNSFREFLYCVTYSIALTVLVISGYLVAIVTKIRYVETATKVI